MPGNSPDSQFIQIQAKSLNWKLLVKKPTETGLIPQCQLFCPILSTFHKVPQGWGSRGAPLFLFRPFLNSNLTNIPRKGTVCQVGGVNSCRIFSATPSFGRVFLYWSCMKSGCAGQGTSHALPCIKGLQPVISSNFFLILWHTRNWG